MEIQWPLALFTLAMCAASGMFAGQGVLVLLGRGRASCMPALITELVVVAIGGIASFFHLQHWERIFNGFGHLTSGITQELIGIVVLVIAMAVFFVVVRKTDDDAPLPKWLGVMALAVGVAMVLIGAHAYQMPARPVWSGPMTYVYFFASAFAIGAAALWAVCACAKEADLLPALAKWTCAGGIVAALAAIAFGLLAQGADFSTVLSYSDPTWPTLESSAGAAVVNDVVFGEYAPLFWGLAVAVGGVAPAVLGAVGMRLRSGKSVTWLAIAAVACAAAGSLGFRAAFYLMGASVYGLF